MHWTRLALNTVFCTLCGMLLISGYSKSAMLSVTCDISVAGDTKTYTYTLLNNYELALTTDQFLIWMPKTGARAVTSFTSSDPSWEARIGGIGDNSYWVIDGNGHQLPSGGTMQLYLSTPASVPTTYTFTVPNLESPVTNWLYTIVGDHIASAYGDTILPVPSGAVPEPSGLLAFLTGLGGLGGVLLKRRK